MRTAIEPIRVMAGVILRRKYREHGCGKPIDLRLNTNGKWMPFTRGATPLHTEQHEVTHVKHDLMSRDDLHFRSCLKRQSAAGVRA